MRNWNPHKLNGRDSRFILPSMSAASPIPPNFTFPKFDATLGALYVGSGVATV
jgi:hypothetical protein